MNPPATLLAALTLALAALALAVPPASAAEVAIPPPACYAGFAQDWCTVDAAGCHAVATTWTAWGDRSVVATCAEDGVACSAAVHTDDLAGPVFGCAPTAAATESASPAPCILSPPSHVGFDCTVGPVHCAFSIWVDLNPPNPTWDCLT